MRAPVPRAAPATLPGGPVSVACLSAPHGAGYLLSFVPPASPTCVTGPSLAVAPVSYLQNQSRLHAPSSQGSHSKLLCSFDVSKTYPWGTGEAVFKRPCRVEVFRQEKLGWEHSPVKRQPLGHAAVPAAEGRPRAALRGGCWELANVV